MAVKSYQKLVVVMCFLSIVTSISVLAVCGVLIYRKGRIELQTADSEPNPPFACVPSNMLIRYAEDPLFESLETVQHDRAKSKCAHNSQQMSALIELSMRRSKTMEIILNEYDVNDFQFSPFSMHKGLVKPSANSIVTGQDSLTKRGNKLSILPMDLGVQHSGDYYIYSSIYFNVENCRHFRFQTWQHKVTKLADEQSTTLLKTTHTCCDTCTEDAHSSFTGGIFHLKKGDVIQILVTEEGLAGFDEDLSYAGLIKLGSGD